MDLLTSWVTGAVTYVLTAFAGTVLAVALAAEAMLTDGGRLVWTGTTAFAAYGLAAFVASLVHRAGRRDGRARHAVAVLAVPALVALATLAAALVRGTPPMPLAAELVAGPVAAVAAWLVMVRFRGRDEPRSTTAADAALRY